MWYQEKNPTDGSNYDFTKTLINSGKQSAIMFSTSQTYAFLPGRHRVMETPHVQMVMPYATKEI